MGKEDDKEFCDRRMIADCIVWDAEDLPIEIKDKVTPSDSSFKRMYRDHRIGSEPRANENCKHWTLGTSTYLINPGWNLCGWQTIADHLGISVRRAKDLKNEGLPHEKWLNRIWSCTSSLDLWWEDWKVRRREKWVRNLSPYTS